MKLRINAIIRSFDKFTGKTTKLTKVHNLIVNSGLEQVAKIIGKLSTGFDYVAIGEDNTSPTNSDVSLGTEVEREQASISYVADYKVKFNRTFTVGSGVSHDVVEAGIFDSATISGSLMLNRLIFDTHVLDSDNPLQVIITITVSRS